MSLPNLKLLSDRENEVFYLTRDGLSTGEIVKKMKLNSKTVETYYRRMREKLNFKTTHKLRVYALTGKVL